VGVGSRLSAGFCRKAFTLLELLVVIAIISILASLLFPIYSQATKSANTVKCLSNVRQIAMAISLYADDNDNRAPLAGVREEFDSSGARVGWPHADRGAASSLSLATSEYIEDPDLFVCPVVRHWPSSYFFACAHGYVAEELLSQKEADLRSLDGLNLGDVREPSQKPVVFCMSPTLHAELGYDEWSQPPYPPGKEVVAYLDGHTAVIWLTWENYFDALFPRN